MGITIVSPNFSELSHLLLPDDLTVPMQSMDLKIFCPRCREPTYREVRYRSDPQFIGRVLVCEHCGERILEPLASGRECEDC